MGEDNALTIRCLVDTLNECRDAYYNRDRSLMSDKEYDDLFDRLKELEAQTGIVFADSPTVSVGYMTKSKLEKVKHDHPMLSLDKTKSIDDLLSFADGYDCILMEKMDGLTVSLHYSSGKLVGSETRGNGEIGEDIWHNALHFTNVPLHIPFLGELVVDGEAIIDEKTFQQINFDLKEKGEEPYSCQRNLASGSVRQLDPSVTAERRVKFIAWKCVSGCDAPLFHERLDYLHSLGFTCVPYRSVPYPANTEILECCIADLQKLAEEYGYPIDGLVLGYDDVAYGESLGATSHHVRSEIAYKFYDEEEETRLRDIEWTMGKTGILTPTAVFDPVEIDGTIVERASVHNISVMLGLLGDPYVGQRIKVVKKNQIIPQITYGERMDTKGFASKFPLLPRFFCPPHKCPYCGVPTKIEQTNDTKYLVCVNESCNGKTLGRFCHFVSKNAMNINGLSEATIKRFMEKGWLNSFIDVYRLYKHYREMEENMEGFGKKSVDNLIGAIEASRNTTMERFLYALCIPQIGRSAAKTISQYFCGNIDAFMNNCRTFDFAAHLPDFGESMSRSIHHYMLLHFDEVAELVAWLYFPDFVSEQEKSVSAEKISGKTFVITGSLNNFRNREEAVSKIEAFGGKVAGSVSKNTDYLINNDITSASGKNKKAKELGIPIITETELLTFFPDE